MIIDAQDPAAGIPGAADVCIIGAGALVLNDIPDYSIAVGVPAKIIRSRLPIDSVSKASSMELEIPCTRR